jgi:phosphoribosylaminoimidazole carboxylase PurE protein
MKPQVLIVVGSDSDLPVMEGAESILKELRVPYDMTIASAHRTPERTAKIALESERRGIEVIIAGAGMAAHLAGALASRTILPVIGVPVSSSPLNGLDSLLSTVQMPPGVPVATMAIGKAGAKNAAILSAQILGRKDAKVAARLKEFRNKLAGEVDKKDRALKRSARRIR